MRKFIKKKTVQEEDYNAPRRKGRIVRLIRKHFFRNKVVFDLEFLKRVV
jgi:hypothetical protein